MHTALWNIPRPQINWGWELREMWLSLELGTPHSDAVFALAFEHRLSDWELDLLESLGVCERGLIK